MKVYLATLVTIATLVTGSGCAEADGAKAVDAYSVLDKGATKLQEDFNRAKGSVRLLFVVDPICPGCLRGLDDVNRDLLATSNEGSTPILRTLSLRLILSRRSVHVEAQALQP